MVGVVDERWLLQRGCVKLWSRVTVANYLSAGLRLQMPRAESRALGGLGI
jgi:hypothetical protein